MDSKKRERLLLILASATLLIFFQAYMVAPLIPRFAELFNVPVQKTGIIVPAYMIPYGVSTLFFGILADRIGRREIMLFSFGAFIVLTFLTMTVQTMDQFYCSSSSYRSRGLWNCSFGTSAHRSTLSL